MRMIFHLMKCSWLVGVDLTNLVLKINCAAFPLTQLVYRISSVGSVSSFKCVSDIILGVRQNLAKV